MKPDPHSGVLPPQALGGALPPQALDGVLPSQALERLIANGAVRARVPILPEQVQPSSDRKSVV